MMKLNPWVKRKWVRALRSGEYEQGSGDLITCDGGYCCLGVLAAECSPEFLTEPNAEDFVGGAIRVAGPYPLHYGTIPDDLAVTWGLDDDAQDALVEKNDGGWSFKRIATWIETNL